MSADVLYIELQDKATIKTIIHQPTVYGGWNKIFDSLKRATIYR
jgi:hypothetical protein